MQQLLCEPEEHERWGCFRIHHIDGIQQHVLVSVPDFPSGQHMFAHPFFLPLYAPLEATRSNVILTYEIEVLRAPFFYVLGLGSFPRWAPTIL